MAIMLSRRASGALVAVLAVAALALPAGASEPSKNGTGLSERFIRVLQGIAWDRMPARLEEGNTVIELDKSDPKKFWLPDDDARRVIALSDRSATAFLCDMEDAAVANFITMMNFERAKKKWSREQLHMIKWVYLAVMEVRTSYVEERTEDQPEIDELAVAQRAQDETKTRRQDFKCSDEMKKNVERQIEEFVLAWNAKQPKR